MAGSEPADRLSVLERLARAGAVFLDRRVLIILLLGFSSGLPLALSGSTLLLWMKDRGVDLGTIGLYSLVGLPYTIKFLWAPLVDAFDVPFLGRLLGHRRGWLILSQLLLMAAICYLGSLDPLKAPGLIAIAALMVATASATQDIVIDAFRVEYLRVDEQAAGMAYYVAAYRIGLLVSTAGTVAIVAALEAAGVDRSVTWAYGYAATAVFLVIGMAAALMASEPETERKGAEGEQTSALVLRFFRTAYDAFADFLTKRDAILILVFVVLYKLADTFAGVMTGPFVLSIGFDKATYAAIVKGVGLAASIIGGLAGGLLARALPMSRALLLAGVLQMLVNLVFCWQAKVGANPAALALTITVDNFGSAVGTVIFVAYLSALCTSRAHTATQFALLTALSAVGRTTLASVSGFIAETIGWGWFFVFSTIAGIPGLLLLWWLIGRGDFKGIEKREEAVA
jgi:MFS transporter, PAT family, beta-lactamase induction signal transducer AmpG